MAAKSYSASERRGILAIAILALIITAAGIGLSFCNRGNDISGPEVIEMKEIVDSVQTSKIIEHKSKKSKRGKGSNSKKKSKKNKTPKTYRRRRPLDEPV